MGSTLTVDNIKDSGDNALVSSTGSGYKISGSKINLSGTAPSSPVAGDMYYNSSVNALMIYNGTIWHSIYSHVNGEIEIYTSGSTTYAVHTFRDSGTFTMNATKNCNILIVGGGGGGGSSGDNTGSNGMAGGGAGGFVFYNSKSISAGSYSIRVGRGGTSKGGEDHGTGSNVFQGNAGACSGGNSKFETLQIAIGGGGCAAGNNSPGYDGGSGSGANNDSGTIGHGYTNQGNNGGTPGNGSVGWCAGGGGGAKSAGKNYNDSSGYGYGGDGYTEGETVYDHNTGGNVTFNINDKGTAFAGGGAGGRWDRTDTSLGGVGGGGSGGDKFNPDLDGTPGTGGGGAGYSSGSGYTWGFQGGTGGSGIIIIRYAI